MAGIKGNVNKDWEFYYFNEILLLLCFNVMEGDNYCP